MIGPVEGATEGRSNSPILADSRHKHLPEMSGSNFRDE
jgi:hypothetical protein